MNSLKIVLAAGLLSPAAVYALDVTPRVDMQVQATYVDPKNEHDSNWDLTMPNTSIGLTAIEPVESSQFIAHWQAGLDPLSANDDVDLTQQEAYLRWNQGAVSLWAGHLDSLEQSLLVDMFQGALSSPDMGLELPMGYTEFENKAVRLDVASGNYLKFSGQWIVDETVDQQQWRAGAAIQTAEGTVSIVYRDPLEPEEKGIWGTQVTWQSGSTALSALWVAQDEVLTWNLVGRTRYEKAGVFVQYGNDENGDEFYHAGIQQPLTEAVTNYSEVRWQPGVDGWQWSTGFKLAF